MVVNKVHTSTYCVCTLYIRVCTCIYHVRMEIVILEGIWCNNQLTVLAWCIQQWFNQSLQAGSCQNSVEYWNMYRHVYTMYISICKFPFMYMTRTGIYINVQTCLYICLIVCTWYRYVHTMYVHVLHFWTCTDMLKTCLYCFAKSCPGGQDSRCQSQTGTHLLCHYLPLIPITTITKSNMYYYHYYSL